METLAAENSAARKKLRKDAGLSKLSQQKPQKVQGSFSQEPLAYIKLALGARTWGNHAIDLRSMVNLFRYRYYYLFVAGRNLRELSVRERRLGLLIQAVAVASFLVFSALLCISVLYFMRSAAGIDRLPSFFFWSVGLI